MTTTNRRRRRAAERKISTTIFRFSVHFFRFVNYWPDTLKVPGLFFVYGFRRQAYPFWPGRRTAVQDAGIWPRPQRGGGSSRFGSNVPSFKSNDRIRSDSSDRCRTPCNHRGPLRRRAPRAPGTWDRGRLLRGLSRQQEGRRLYLPVLRIAAVPIQCQIRFRHRVAELLQALCRAAHQADPGRKPWDGAGRGGLRPLRQPPWARISGWTATHRRAALPQSRVARLHGDRGGAPGPAEAGRPGRDSRRWGLKHQDRGIEIPGSNGLRQSSERSWPGNNASLKPNSVKSRMRRG